MIGSGYYSGNRSRKEISPQLCGTFGAAYLQALLFLEVMNIYDGIVIDKLWVGHSKFWILPGTEDLPFVQTWTQVLKKRAFLAVIWIAGAAIVAGIVVLLAKLREIC